MTLSYEALDRTLGRRLAHAITSRLQPSSDALRAYLLNSLDQPPGAAGSLLSEPVFEATFDYARAPERLDELGALLGDAVVRALDAAPEERWPADRHPFTHQAEAWRHLLDPVPQSVVVSSGTGSGKTECFLVPILADLARLAVQPLRGIHALFLYPLNALIASQEHRLSAWTQSFGARLRFCLYNGNTPDQVPAATAAATPWQVLDRRTLRATPPPILVTNATMLEYLLVRAQDRPILEASQGRLRWIVLDEAHTYMGSQAAEMALLLRRVMDGFGVEPADVRFVATSATIGADDAQGLRRFLADIAGVPLDRVHLVQGTRDMPRLATAPHLPGLPGLAARAAIAAAEPGPRFGALAGYRGIHTLRDELHRGARTLAELATATGATRADVAACLDLAHPVRDGDGTPLLPLRGHRFIRTLAGAWACMDRSCPGRHGTPLDTAEWHLGKVFFSARERCDACDAAVYELCVCRACGGEALLAELVTGHMGVSLVALGGRSPEVNEIRPDAAEVTEFPEDDEPDEPAAPSRRLLGGSAAGAGIPGADPPASVDRQTGDYGVPGGLEIALAGLDDQGHLQCARCGNSDADPDAVVGRMYASRPFLLSTALPLALRAMPAAAGAGTSLRPLNGRRLLAFTDSRQGTARFATLLEQEAQRRFVQSWLYHQLWASRPVVHTSDIEAVIAGLLPAAGVPQVAELIAERRRALAELQASAPRPRLRWDEAVNRLADHSDLEPMSRAMSSLNPDFQDRHLLANFLLLREFLRRPRRRVSVETLGLVVLAHPRLERATAPRRWLGLGGTGPEWSSFLHIALDVVRSRNAVLVQPSLRHWLGETYAPRFLTPPDEAAPAPQVRLYTAGTARPRGRLVDVLCRRFDLDPSDPSDQALLDALLSDVWQVFTSPGVLGLESDGRRLDPRTLELVVPETILRCPLTGRALVHALDHRTPYAKLDTPDALAVVRALPAAELPVAFPHTDAQAARVQAWLTSDPRVQELREAGLWIEFCDRVAEYARYYRTQEHSAQLRPDRLRALEDEFERGFVNILSCSTTMEMGVDIGGLSVVAMNNAPPGPANFLQRAGRAGRRGETAALSLTTCRPSPHDEAVFADPTWPFRTPIAIPRVALDSVRIVRRHVHALLLSRYFRTVANTSAISLRCGDFMRADAASPASSDGFIAWLRATADNASNPMLFGALGTLTTATALAGVDPAHLLLEAATRFEQDVQLPFREELARLAAELDLFTTNDAARRSVELSLARLEGEFLLKELTARAWLPAHGFPSGVLPLVTATASAMSARTAQLGAQGGRDDQTSTWRDHPSRDLAVAISEYAPGASVVIDGRVYESSGVTLNWHIPPTALDAPPEIQALRFAALCPRCGEITDQARRAETCEGCRAPLDGHRHYLQPAGFAVDFSFVPHNDLTRTRTCPAEPAWVSARGATWEDATVPFARWRGATEGRIFHHNGGPDRDGYAICLRCGAASAMRGGQHELAGHRPLRGYRSQQGVGGTCRGNADVWAIQTGLTLGGVVPTDVFELQLREPELGARMTESQVISIGAALRQALAEALGIESRELGLTASKHLWESEQSAAIVLYDNAPGGAGYAPMAADRVHDLLQRAATILSCPDRQCDRACHACLLSFDTDRYGRRLDRFPALEFVNAVLNAWPG